MWKAGTILHQTPIQLFFLWLTFSIFSSCSQSNPKQPNAVAKTDTAKPPVTISVNKPFVTRLDTCPQPQTIYIPEKPGGSYALKTKSPPKKLRLLPPVTKPADIYIYMQNYDIEQGLAFSSVVGSCMDKRGNLWFATRGGVSRYDGKSFTNYTTVQGLVDNTVWNILEDKRGNLWFTTKGGISCFDGRSFKNYTTADGLVSNYVLNILEDSRGNFWFGTTDGVSRLDRNRATFTTYTSKQGLAFGSVSGIIEDKSGNLWFGTLGGGVSRYDGNIFTTYTIAQGLASNIVQRIIEDKKGNLWFATDAGISHYNGSIFTTYTTAQGLASNKIWSIHEDKSGNLWFGTWGGGVSRLDQNGRTFTSYTTAQGLANNNVLTILEDKGGNLWFGTDGGVSCLNHNLKSLLIKQVSTTSYDIVALLEDKSGNLWIGTWGAGVTRLDKTGKSFTNYTTAQGLANNIVVSLFEDKSGNLWFGTWGGGVSRLSPDGKSFTNYTTAQGLAGNTIKSIFEDKSGNLWFGFLGGRVSWLDSNRKSFTSFALTQGIANTHIESIHEDKRGNIWFGTFEGGVFRLEPDGKSFTNYATAQGLANNNVWSIQEDKSGHLWFGTDAGISRYDGTIFTTYNTIQGLSDNIILDMVTDNEGLIWLGTLKGFTTLKVLPHAVKYSNNRKESVQPLNEHSNDERKGLTFNPVFEIYNNKTGYPIKSINTMCITHEGVIWAGTGDKLLRFDYRGIHNNPDAPNVFIQNIKINNENISWYNLENSKLKTESSISENSATIPARIVEETSLFGKPLNEEQRDTMRKKFSGVKFDSITRFYHVPANLVLPYRHNNITIDFAAIEPARPTYVYYQYILEGYDKQWSPVSNKTTASFGNIQEGNYTFKVKAQSPDGVWSKPLIYTFKVLPPWHRTWWAYTLYGLLFLAGVYAVHRYQRQRLIQKERERARAKELAQAKEIEKAYTELKATQVQLIQKEKMASLGELTAGIAHEIENPLNFVNNFSEVNTELIQELKQENSTGKGEKVEAIADEIEQNLQKITHHGKRADAIVKGMLQHSRVSTGEKQPTDINALVDEYLRLSYLGMRAKDKAFNAVLQTDFDNRIGKIDVVSQDIGRVLVNLFNNAFYSVNQKKLQLNGVYEPTVSVSTKKTDGRIEISIHDNGMGIPQKIVEKIYQPFFTTKPPGQGTGLGLSLSYDIITKEHGGELKVETKEGEFAEFIISLPKELIK